MQTRNLRILVGILALTAIAAWISLSGEMKVNLDLGGLKIDREIKAFLGLDLQGGIQVMLEADVPPGSGVVSESMDAAKSIIENRVNGLGVSEPMIQRQGSNRIIVELPGLKDPALAIRTFGQTGLLEFVDTGSLYLDDGTVITTTGSLGTKTSSSATATPAAGSSAPLPGSSLPTPAASQTVSPTVQPAATTTPIASPTVTAGQSITASGTTTATTQPKQPAIPDRVFPTIMTGKHLKSADVSFDETGLPEVKFSLTDEGAKLMADYSSANVGRYMAIAMDKVTISCPVIRNPITTGEGVITGKFSLEEVRSLVIQLKYGALPVPLKVVENRQVGPTLGQDSVTKSLVAGGIGLGIVILFMLLYYRLPGLLADVALVIYTLVVFALFKLIPVTLTVPGIAGFVLSIGMAVDANILIFERTREELRSGKTIGAAVEAGFSRAWTSIRDSNVSTLITCAILFWFGMNFGASIIKGFALTLGIGVVISMFTAIVVTRTFLRVLVTTKLGKRRSLFAIVDEKES